MSIINADYRTAAGANYPKACRNTNIPDRSMASVMTDILAGSGNAEDTSKADETPSGDMSMAEYIQYIDAKIAQISRGAHRRQDFIFIFISEEGYEAMKQDSEYEAWVLESIRDAYAGANYWHASRGNYHCFKLFGATREECHSESWYSGGRDEQEQYWERKMQRKKRLKALLKKMLEKKRLEKAAYDKFLMEKWLAHQRLLDSYYEDYLETKKEQEYFDAKYRLLRKLYEEL